ARWTDAPAKGPVDGGTDPAVCGRNARAGALRESTRVYRSTRLVPQLSTGPRCTCVQMEGARKGRAQAAVAPARQPDEEATPPDAQPSGVSVRIRCSCALAISPGASVHAGVEWPALRSRVPTRRVHVGALWR